MVDGDEEDEEDEEMDLGEQGSTIIGQSNSYSTFLPSLVEPLLDLILPTPLSFPPISGGPSQHPPTTSVLSSIHISALECLNNIFLSLAALSRSQNSSHAVIEKDIASGPKVWNEIWNALTVVGTETEGPGQEGRREMWYLSIGVLWGVGQVWKKILVNLHSIEYRFIMLSDLFHIQVPNEEQVRILIQFYNSVSNDAVKVKCLGALESLAQYPHSIEANRVSISNLPFLFPSSHAYFVARQFPCSCYHSCLRQLPHL